MTWWPYLVPAAIFAVVLGVTVRRSWRDRWEILRSLVEDFPYFVGAAGMVIGIAVLLWLL